MNITYWYLTGTCGGTTVHRHHILTRADVR